MKRIKLFITALVLSLSSVLGVIAPQVHAAGTFTWDGGGSDNNMTTDANWVGDTAPTGDADEDLVFPIAAASVRYAPVNDYTAGTAFNSITFSSSNGGQGWNLSGNAIEVVGGITTNAPVAFDLPIELSADQAVTADTEGTYGMTFNDVLSGSGDVALNGPGNIYLNSANTITGAITIATEVGTNDIDALGGTSAGTTISAGGSLQINVDEADKDGTLAEPFTFSVGDNDGGAVFSIGVGCGMGGGCDSADITLSGSMTFAEDTIFKLPYSGQKVTLTGNLSGAGKKITLSLDSLGTLVIDGATNNTSTENGTYGFGATGDMTLSDDTPGATVAVPEGRTYIITGTYGDTTVYGTLKGTGTVGDLSVAAGGTLAPGMSPGCIHSDNLFLGEGSTYSVEIGGTKACDEYDQTVVTGTVSVRGALSVTRYDGFVPTAGQKYVIINNDGTDEVSTGYTFEDLAEGATFTTDGVTYSISYVGGDGNDVELTVTAVSPDTGFALLTNNPFITVALMLGAAGGIAILARRQLGFAFRKR